MNEFFEIAFNLSMLLFIVGSMITMGLDLAMSQIVAPFKNIKFVILVLLANFIMVPMFAFYLLQWLSVAEGVRIGILLLSVGGGAPFIPMLVGVAKGHIGGAVGVMVFLLIVSLFFIPLVVPVLLPGTSVSSWNIAKPLISIMLLPLVLALLIKAYCSAFAARVQPFFAVLTRLSTVILIISVLYLYTETIFSSVDMLAAILVFFLGTMVIGDLTAGKSRDMRIIMTVGAGLRNPPVAILIASQNFAPQPVAAIVPLLAAIIAFLVLLPWAMIFRRQAA